MATVAPSSSGAEKASGDSGFSVTRMLNKLTEFGIITAIFAVAAYLAYHVRQRAIIANSRMRASCASSLVFALHQF